MSIVGEYDRETVVRLFREYEFRTLIDRLPLGVIGLELLGQFDRFGRIGPPAAYRFSIASPWFVRWPALAASNAMSAPEWLHPTTSTGPLPVSVPSTTAFGPMTTRGTFWLPPQLNQPPLGFSTLMPPRTIESAPTVMSPLTVARPWSTSVAASSMRPFTVSTLPCTREPRSGESSSGVGFEAGGGVEMRLGGLVSITPGLRYVRYGEETVAMVVGDVGMRFRF